MLEATLNNITLQVITGDLTTLATDALVHAASPDLDLNATGLGRAILEKAGDKVVEECRAIRFADAGEAVITSAGNLPVRHIIHAVMPRMGDGGERGKIASAIWNALRLAVQHQATSIAFPAMATGRHSGYPVEASARVMAQKIVDFTFEEVGTLTRIVVCIYVPEMLPLFEETFRREISAAQADVQP